MSVRRLSNSFISTEGRGKSSTLLAGYSPAIDEMDLIERITVGSGGAASITFSNIPQTYEHLQLRMSSRLSAGTLPTVSLEFNDISTTSYAYILMRGSGSAATSEQNQNQTSATCITSAGGAQTASVFSGVITDIVDYKNSNKNKTIRTISGADFNGTGWIDTFGALFINTSAITKIRIFHTGGSSFSQHSVASLYGVV